MRYLTKGDLLNLLGANANSFTSFLINPAGFGVTDPLLSELVVVKQKFDWTAGINLDLPEIQQMMAVLRGYGVLTDKNMADLAAVADTQCTDYVSVIIHALDDVTITNQTGAVLENGMWRVSASFLNATQGTTITENFMFGPAVAPSLKEVNTALAAYVTQLRQG